MSIDYSKNYQFPKVVDGFTTRVEDSKNVKSINVSIANSIKKPIPVVSVKKEG